MSSLQDGSTFLTIKSSEKNICYLYLIYRGFIKDDKNGKLRPDYQQQRTSTVLNDNTCELNSNSGLYCTKDLTDTQSIDCKGDSGGPSMFYLNGKWHLYGIVSYGLTATGYCDSNYPNYYTKITAYLEWIGKSYLFKSYRIII